MVKDPCSVNCCCGGNCSDMRISLDWPGGMTMDGEDTMNGGEEISCHVPEDAPLFVSRIEVLGAGVFLTSRVFEFSVGVLRQGPIGAIFQRTRRWI